MVGSNLCADTLLVQTDHDEFMDLDADQQAEASHEELDAQVVPMKRGDADYAANQVEHVSQHVDEEIFVVSLPLGKDELLFIIDGVGHLLAGEIDVMPPFSDLCAEEA